MLTRLSGFAVIVCNERILTLPLDYSPSPWRLIPGTHARSLRQQFSEELAGVRHELAVQRASPVSRSLRHPRQPSLSRLRAPGFSAQNRSADCPSALPRLTENRSSESRSSRRAPQVNRACRQKADSQSKPGRSQPTSRRWELEHPHDFTQFCLGA